VGVPLASIAAFAEDKFLTGLRKIGYRLFLHFIVRGMTCAVNNSSDWNLESRWLRASAHFIFSLTMSAPFGSDERLKKKRNQTIHIVVSDQNDVPAPPAITTIRPPTRNEFFAAKAAAAIPSVTGLGVHPYLIYKLHSGKVAEMGSQVDGNLLSATK
jgi:hypothetical protein